MSRNEALAHIENATISGGLDGSYKAFNEEYSKIMKGPDEQAKQAQLQDLADGLKKDGLLPAISLNWAGDNFTLLGTKDGFSPKDLDEFRNRSTSDTMSRAMATSLMDQYTTLRDSYSFFEDNGRISPGDILFGRGKYNYLANEFKGDHIFSKFAEDLKANNYALFDKISGGDKNKNTVTLTDINTALDANKTAQKYGQSILTEAEQKELTDAKQAFYLGRANPSPYVKNGIMTKDGIASLAPRQLDAFEQSKGDAPATAPEVKAEAKADAKPEPKADAKPEAKPSADAGPQQLDALKQFLKTHFPDPDHVLQLLNSKVAEVHAGDGYDRIARRELRKIQGSEPSEADVLRYSEQIATFNGEKNGRLNAFISRNKPVILPEFMQDK